LPGTGKWELFIMESLYHIQSHMFFVDTPF
jgi:hypothetical protein